MTQRKQTIEKVINVFADKEYPSEDSTCGIKTYGQIPHFVSNLRKYLTEYAQSEYQRREDENDELLKDLQIMTRNLVYSNESEILDKYINQILDVLSRVRNK